MYWIGCDTLIPRDNTDLFDFEIKKQPSKTYTLNYDSIGEVCDELKAIQQSIELILSIERYQYPIYSWNYGVELQDLYGQPKSFVIPELERRIQEALTQDDRVESVDNFTFETNKNSIQVNFLVHTNYGDIKSEKKVKM